jgi:hypothetical protein
MYQVQMYDRGQWHPISGTSSFRRRSLAESALKLQRKYGCYAPLRVVIAGRVYGVQ